MSNLSNLPPADHADCPTVALGRDGNDGEAWEARYCNKHDVKYRVLLEPDYPTEPEAPELDEILESARAGWNLSQGPKDNAQVVAEAKAALLAWHLREAERIIGPDEIDMITRPGGSTYDSYVEPMSFNNPDCVKRNELRAEQRAALHRGMNDVSLCPHCNCMTHTTSKEWDNATCGKCGGYKGEENI